MSSQPLDPGGKPKGVVLVVDDDAINRNMLKNFLEHEGYSTREAPDGDEALRLVAESFPDVILLDVVMPKLSGLEVCRRLKADPKTAHLPILLVTALTEREARLKGIEAGADDFIAKPMDREEVALRLRNAIRTKRLFDELQARYDQLRQMQELRDSLTQMLVNDTQSMKRMLGGTTRPADRNGA
jgi:PleD family two-component response regulator